MNITKENASIVNDSERQRKQNESSYRAEWVLISSQRLWLLPLVMPAGWGHGGWATSSLVPSLSCLLFPSGSCPNHCQCPWINTTPAALQSKPGSSKAHQTWSTSSDLRSQLIYIKWPRVWKTLMLAMNTEYSHCNLYSVVVVSFRNNIKFHCYHNIFQLTLFCD